MKINYSFKDLKHCTKENIQVGLIIICIKDLYMIGDKVPVMFKGQKYEVIKIEEQDRPVFCIVDIVGEHWFEFYPEKCTKEHLRI